MSTEPAHPVADPVALTSTDKSVAGLSSPSQANGTGTSPNHIHEFPESSDANKWTAAPEGAHSSNAAAEDAGEGDSKQKRSLLNVPRSASQSNETQTPTTGLSGATAADSESIGRGSKHSKRSFLNKRRAGSTASSKRSQARAGASEKIDQPPPVPAMANREGSTRTRKSGGLLSCLPCFAPKDTGDSAPSENVKQAQKAPASRTSQSTPVKKQEQNAVDSSKQQGETLDEKAGASSKPTNSDGTVERPSNDNRPQIVTRSSSKRNQVDQSSSQPGMLQAGQPQINVQGATPGTTPILPRPSAEQARIIEDQTPEQKAIDDDIEMKDVPLSSDDVHHEGEDESSEAQNDHAKIALPPPPPLEERKEVVQGQITDMSDASEPQKYLLGPIAPRFQGKKCLVLDLDETLVHSSFKVR